MRLAMLVAATGAIAAALLVTARGETRRARLVQQPPASSGPAPTAPRPQPTTTLNATPFEVGSTSTTVEARSATGAPVSIPTVVWYPVGRPRASFPLLVFSPGFQIDPSAYDPLTNGWAAAGYVVAEPVYPDTAPGAPPIESDMVNHPAELEQVISALIEDSAQGSLPVGNIVDPGEIAVAGQSDGGDVSAAAADNTCCRDPRIKAAVILSGAEASLFRGAYFGSGGPPLLTVQGTADTINSPACSEQLYDAAPLPRYYLNLAGASHLSAYTAAGPQLSVVLAVTTAFLDGYVKSVVARLSEIARLAGASAAVRLTSGSTTVPLAGTCPGAP